MVSRKRLIVIGIIAGIGVIALIIISIINATSPKKAADESGGAGTPEKGTVILTGFEMKDSSGVSAGEITSTRVQLNIRALLQTGLRSKKMLDTYHAYIVDGSLKIDYSTNNVSYTIKCDDPSTTFTVTFNTTDDGSLEVSKDGQLLDFD